MPLLSRKKGESKDSFVSRCVSDLASKGEGKDNTQRVAICMSKANSDLSDAELELIESITQEMWTKSCADCNTLDEDEHGSVELFSTAKENKKAPRALNKPFRTPKGPKKFSVYVKNDKGNIVKVNFGDPNMEIKRDDPSRRKNFRARHNCDNPGPKWKARYWSCRFWEKSAPVSKLTAGEDGEE